MRQVLSRVWAGIVFALVGACVGFVVTIVLASMRVSLDTALWSVAGLAALGFVLGVSIGNRKIT
jgi:hypothetical protein